ncbi:MAG: hypothetical protein H7333_08660 [Bdellovibrionales bacterium]|nr:hypothetical protein [Oligoflexia bacterium]
MVLQVFRFSFVLGIAALTTDVWAAETTTLHSYRFQQKTFEPDASLSCQIKRFTLINTHQEMKDTIGPSTAHFTSMAAMIDTTGPECLRNYGVVQYIQGCMSNQEMNKHTGRLTKKHYGTIRTSREKDIYFAHPQLEVDSLNIDPLYASKPSNEEGDRQGWYYISKTPLKMKDKRADVLADDYLFQRPSSRIFLENANSTHTQVYVADLPSQAAFHLDDKYSVALISTPSLDFKTCVYEMKNIPNAGDPAPPDTPRETGGPLICFQWSHKFEFDAKKMNFDAVTSTGTDPFCMSPTPKPSANLSL